MCLLVCPECHGEVKIDVNEFNYMVKVLSKLRDWITSKALLPGDSILAVLLNPLDRDFKETFN